MSTDHPKHGDVSAAFARARRQREADNAGRPDRIADLGRGIVSLIPPARLGIGGIPDGERLELSAREAWARASSEG